MSEQLENATYTTSLPLSMVRVRPGHNPRRRFNQDEHEGLCHTLREEGLMHPTAARKLGEEEFEITYQHGGGEPYQVDGIFESATEAVDVDTGAPVLSYQPRVSFALAELRAVPKSGDTCVIRGTRYAVVEPVFDGQGTVTLRLHEAQDPITVRRIGRAESVSPGKSRYRFGRAQESAAEVARSGRTIPIRQKDEWP